MKRFIFLVLIFSSFGIFCQNLINNPFVYEKNYKLLGDFKYSIQVTSRKDVVVGEVVIYESPRYIYVWNSNKNVLVTYLINELIAVNSKENKMTYLFTLNDIKITADMIIVSYLVREGTAVITYEKIR